MSDYDSDSTPNDVANANVRHHLRAATPYLIKLQEELEAHKAALARLEGYAEEIAKLVGYARDWSNV